MTIDTFTAHNYYCKSLIENSAKIDTECVLIAQNYYCNLLLDNSANKDLAK